MNSPVRTIQRVRHETRLRTLAVVNKEYVTPGMVRITLGGNDLDGFVSAGFDDHVKLFFPQPGAVRPVLPTAVSSGPAAPDDSQRIVARDFTPRRYDAAAQRLTIEFALHDAGPATAWAEQAQPGQLLGVGGPRGSFIIPVEFACHVLIGDETALPAINRRLEELPSSARAVVICEVDSVADQQSFATAARLDAMWVHRRNAVAAAEPLLLRAVRSVSLPAEDVFVWAAGESALAKALRLHFVKERGLPKDRVKAAGYWRRGAAAVHDKFDD